jgi:cyclophilin family peptidyl-prolyl cis-trans isomerase/HEAT repeat protein
MKWPALQPPLQNGYLRFHNSVYLMRSPILLLLAVASLSFGSVIAQDRAEQQRVRAEKFETILREQDRRLTGVGSLVKLINDQDAAVRERAILAYGSLQDTAVVHLLVARLTDSNSSVQFAAAFAIGQTAGLMSVRAKEQLQHDLIWVRLDRMRTRLQGALDPAGRMVEEIGRFGTEEALRDLITRFGIGYPLQFQQELTMSIARFAIRGIITAEATQYLLRFVKPFDRSTWQTAYALQRIGDRPEIRGEIENVAELSKHNDPLVRMNVAVLLGKIRHRETSLEPLIKLAEFDPDWRVRVNALKALANFDVQNDPIVLEVFRRAFYDRNTNVSTTALSAFGSSNFRPDGEVGTRTLESARQIAQNNDRSYLWQLQAEAAIAIARRTGADAIDYIRPEHTDNPRLQAQLILALGYSGSLQTQDVITNYLGSSDPLLYRSALDALKELAQRNPSNTSVVSATYDAAVTALDAGDMAIITTGATMLGDSILARPESVPALLRVLERLRVPNDVEPMQEIIATLGKLGDSRSVNALRRILQQSDRSVALASLSALRSITGRDYRSDLPRYFEPLYTDFDFGYLRSLPDTISIRIETIRGNIDCELYTNQTPFTVMSFLKLAGQRGFFRGSVIHRVVPNFVIQDGDPRGDGWGGPGYAIRSEFSPLRYETGTLGMASAGKDTEGSQFFITHSPQPHLDGRYTIIGRVKNGMDVVDQILVGDRIFDVKRME